jgi:ribosome-associated protein
MNSILQITSSIAIPLSELRFRTSRSSGPGGQNVNKLETRVELTFDLSHSPSLDDDQRQQLSKALASKLDSHGLLRIAVQHSRSQWENKQLAIERFIHVLQQALKRRKKRIRSTPTAASQELRLQKKKRAGLKKELRKKGRLDDE